MVRILLLGEGNFTFTQDLAELLVKSSSSQSIVTTSFDSRSELSEKYPTIEKTLRGLKNYDQTQAFHGIDATKCLKSQLLSSACTIEVFDHIIFNFPHLGYEDCKAHSSLVGHILYRAHEILSDNESPPRASFYLTLAESQAQNWNLQEMAIRNGMECYDIVPFVKQLWPNYEQKRHHCSKSFRNRVQDCFHYCFRKKSMNPNMYEKIEVGKPSSMLSAEIDLTGSNSNLGNLFRYLSKSMEQSEISNIVLPDTSQLCISAVDNIRILPDGVCGNNTKNSNVSEIVKDCRKSQSKKMKKKDDLIRNGYTKISEGVPSLCDVSGSADEGHAPTISTASLLFEQCWECRTCNRRLKSEQGIKTHVYMVHVLDTNKQSESDSGLGSTLILCEFCEKVLPNQDALYQHNVAKHSGKFLSLKPSWAAVSLIHPAVVSLDEIIHDTFKVDMGNLDKDQNHNASESIAEQGPLHECLICGLQLLSKELLDNHLLGWQPLSISKTFNCRQCNKYFSDDRGRLQHMNFCNNGKIKI